MMGSDKPVIPGQPLFQASYMYVAIISREYIYMIPTAGLYELGQTLSTQLKVIDIYVYILPMYYSVRYVRMYLSWGNKT